MTKINAKDAIEKIRKMLFSEAAPEPAPTPAPDAPDPVAYTLKDGTTIKLLGNLDPGTQVLVETPDGDQPAPDGELELSDGTLLTITNGLIAAIETPQQETEEKNGGEQPDEIQFTPTDQLKAKILAIEKEITAFRESFVKQNTAQKELLDLVSAIATLPSVEPISTPKNAFSETKTKQEAKLRQLAECLKRLKK